MSFQERWRRVVWAGAVVSVVLAGVTSALRAAPAATPVMDWQFDGEVRATARIGNVIYVGGNFRNVTPRAGGAAVARAALAEFDATTGALLPATIVIAPPLSEVRNLAAVGQVLYATGEFGTVNGVSYSYGSFAYDVGSSSVLTWSRTSTSANNRIVHADASGIYIAVSNGLVRRHDLTTGAEDPVWQPDLTANIVAADGELWASRPFPNFSINPFQGGGTSVGVLDPVTGLFDERFRTPLVLPWYGLAVHGDTVYIAGQLPDLTLQINQPDVSDRVLAFSRSTGVQVSPTVVGDIDSGQIGTPSAMTVADGRLVVAGRRMVVGGQERLGLAEVAGPAQMTAWTAVTNFRGQGVQAAGDLLVAFGIATDVASTGRVVAYRLDGLRPPSALTARTLGPATTFAWTPGAPTPPGGYVIDGGVTPGQVAGAVPLGNVTTSTLTVPGTFFVRVRAANAVETSNEVVAGCITAPRPPTALRATVAGSALSIAWTAPPGPLGGFLVEAGTAAGASNLARVSLPGSQTSIGAAVPPGRYHMQVRASNACGTSLPSGAVYVDVGAVASLPAAPLDFVVQVFGVGSVPNVAHMTWTAPPGAVTAYRLEAGTAPGLADLTTLPLGSTAAFQIAGVPRGEYYLRVRAVNAAGVGPASRDVLLKMP